MHFDCLDIWDVLDGYRKRRFKPSEVITCCLSNIERQNPKLNAMVELQPEKVLQKALELDGKMHEFSKQPLFGIPIVLKDIFLARGWRATAGSKYLGEYQSPFSAPTVERLEQAGAIIIGKSNMDEFAMGSSTENSAFGPTRNPWDLNRVPGGSSGGSAAAVAAGFCSAALGTDTGGSIRQPASFCGVVGLKPSYGRVSRYGIVAFASSLDQVGPITKTVWDAARVLEVIAGYHGKDATVSRQVVPLYSRGLKSCSIKKKRLGVAWNWLEGVDREIEKAFSNALDILKTEGVEIVAVDLPSVKYAISTYYLLATSEASSNLARYDGIHYGRRSEAAISLDEVYSKSRSEGFGKEVKLRIMIGTYALSAGYYDAFYMRANQVRGLIKEDFREAFNRCDCIMTPTSPTTAFLLGERISDPIQMYLSDVFTVPANLAGLPAISVPGGLDSKYLPIGIQLIGRPFCEGELFHWAQVFERLRGRLPSPDLEKGRVIE